MAKDELAEINGIKPKFFLLDGEEKDVSSMSRHVLSDGNNIYHTSTLSSAILFTKSSVLLTISIVLVLYVIPVVLRPQLTSFTFEGLEEPVNARTCKHLKSLLGDKYEEARLKLKNPNGPPPKSTAKKPASKLNGKPVSKRKKADAEDEDASKPAKRGREPRSSKSKARKDDEEDDEEDDDEERPAKRARKPVSKKKNVDDNDDDEIKPAKNTRKPASNRANANDDDNATGLNKAVPELLLANKWDIQTGPDPVGWWISEKLDGVRTYYDGKDMISRLGNPFTPPKWFLEKLPKDVTLDGELFGGRGQFQSTVSIVKTINSPHWKGITFQIFDIPSKGNLPFEKRIDLLKKLFGPGGDYASDLVKIVEHEKATSRSHVLDKLKEIESLGGEGLMLRKPASEYEGRRSGSLLKIKTFYDAEAVVIGHAPGKGRHQGSTGALKCKMQSGKTFNVGTGLSDKQRKNPPKIGAIITYRFQELTRDGVPRFPSYIGEAVDKDKAKDAEIPEHRKPGSKPADE
ncbi:hypothetical protein C0991_003817 [Blastosporella zonata]|nr:hypothetical protein C0991_003817 [Blastosporella zonata]